MSRNFILFNFINNKSSSITVLDIENGFKGFTTNECSHELNIDRSNCSRELNQLYDEKKLVKVKGKPVHYFSVNVLEKLLNKKVTLFEVDDLKYFLNHEVKAMDSFEIIGANGSLKNSISKSKAAMLYPPFGLHSLLVGPTGVGKTMFADLMFEFARTSGVLDDDAVMVTFNCAEYADNPQLILSQLFGHKKGSFTGASADKEGLVYQANNGILFLDEIHRLPAEGQEMLFMLMDKNQYRKLGESDVTHNAKVLIIAATTENVHSSLLETFIRRIPMVVDIPSLAQRPVSERYLLLLKFFSEESVRTNMNVNLSKVSIKALLGYTCTGNVGQLNSDIKLVCARAYLNSIMEGKTELKIDKSILPDHILKGIIDANENNEINNVLDKIKNDSIIFSPDNSTSTNIEIDYKEDVYTKINKQFEKYNFVAMLDNSYGDQSNIKSNLVKYVESLFDTVSGNRHNNEELYKIVSPKVYNEIEVALKIAEKMLNRVFSKKTYVSFAIHVNAFIETRNIRDTSSKDMNFVQENYPKEYEVAKIIRDYLCEELQVEIPENELTFFTLFLIIDEEAVENKNHVAVLILAHGNGIAMNMAQVANTLLNTNHAHGMDMSLDEDVHDFFEKVETKAKQIDEGSGIIILVDMGSLRSFGDIISSKYGIPTKTIDMVSTLTVLETTRKSLIGDYTLDDIYFEMSLATKEMVQKENNHNKNTDLKENVIISTCMTGIGAAVQISKYCMKALPSILKNNIQFINTNNRDFDLTSIENKHVIAVIGSVDLKLKNIPYIDSESLLVGNGLTYLNTLINQSLGVLDSKSDEVKNAGLAKVIEDTLQFSDVGLMLKHIDKSFKFISDSFRISEYNRMMVSYYMHTSAMIERIIQNKILNYNEVETYIQSNDVYYKIFKQALKEIETFYNIFIPDTEIAYIIEMFDTH